VAIISGVFAVFVAIISGVFAYYSGSESV